MTLDRNHIVGMATPPDYLVIQWEDAILDMQELHNDRQAETKKRIEEFTKRAEQKPQKPISEVIDDLLDTMDGVKNKFEDNVIELFPNDEKDDTIH